MMGKKRCKVPCIATRHACSINASSSLLVVTDPNDSTGPEQCLNSSIRTSCPNHGQMLGGKGSSVTSPVTQMWIQILHLWWDCTSWTAWTQPDPQAFSPGEQRSECTQPSPASSWSESADFTIFVLRLLMHQTPGPAPQREARRVRV